MAGRVFDAARKAQGFKSQEHLDAFYAYHDHSKQECCQHFEQQVIGGSFDWSCYAVQQLCAEGQRLQQLWDAF